MDEVHELLARQGGIARERDVVQAGFSRKRVRLAIREDRLRRLAPNLVTNVRQPPPDEQLRAAVVALDGTVSHEDAALLWGVELVTTPCQPHVTVARNRSRCRRPDTVVHRADLCAEDRVERSGMWITSLLRTLLDLCRSLPLPDAVAASDSALRRGLVTPEELLGSLRELPAGRGRDRVARVLRLIDPESGSVLESMCRVLLTLAGLAPPQTQLVVRDGAGRWIGRVDFAWPEQRLVVETDGFAFHADRRSYRADRRRGNALVLAGWRVLRFSWEDIVEHPDEVVAAVRAALTSPPALTPVRPAARPR